MSENQVHSPWKDWKITNILGRGSFGQVYEIERNNFGSTEKAAMKVISVPANEMQSQAYLNQGFSRESVIQRNKEDMEDIAKEYTLMSELKGNSNIVYADDIYTEQSPDGLGWVLYIRMELLSPLHRAMQQPVEEERVIQLGIDMCHALSFCRKKNIIHRDIKPSNILVAADGRYMLGDFGIAKVVEGTCSGTRTGTYEYMAPEVYNNQRYGFSADLYSLGMVMYWVLNTGCGPFLPLPPTIPKASQCDEAMQRRFHGEKLPLPARGSESLQNIVLKACSFHAEDRYQTPEEMQKDLEELRDHGVVQIQTDGNTAPVVTVSPYTDKKAPGENKKVAEPTAGIHNTGKISRRDDSGNTKNTRSRRMLWMALASVIVLGVLALAVGLGFHKMPGNESAHDQTELNHQTEINHQTEMTRPSAVSHEWSEWTDTMPSSVSESGYEIESRTLYSSRTLEKTSSAEDSMPGWELYDTKTVDDGYGEWSGWSSDYVSESEDREVEEKTWYRYRDEETTTSSSSNKSGWELYDTTWDQWGDYGSWSGWTDSYMSSSNSCDVESKNQYRIRNISYREEYTPWSEWGGWSFDRQSTGDTCEEDERTVWSYYYFLCPNCGVHMHGWGQCYTWAGGCGIKTDDSGWHEIWSTVPWDQAGLKDWHGTGDYYTYLDGELVFQNNNPDVTPRTQYRYRTRSTQQVAEYGDWQEWTDGDGSSYSSDEVETRILYRYREREMLPTYHYCRWSGWSDWQPDYVSGNDSRQVETDTYYRYRDQLTSDTYYFQRWTDWTDYSDQEIEANDEREVRTQTQYRYKKK